MTSDNVNRGQQGARLPQPPNPPLCPQCQRPMRLRSGSYGTFWGCSIFPNCRGTREYNPIAMTKAASVATITSKAPEPVPDFVRSKPQRPAKAKYDPILKTSGSAEQEAIWEYLVGGKSHMVVEALAGTGKTFTGIQGCLRIPTTKRVGFTCYNAHIYRELDGKLTASKCSHVEALTYHRLGNRAVHIQFPNLKTEPDKFKLHDILKTWTKPSTVKDADWAVTCSVACRMAKWVKNYLLYPTDVEFDDRVKDIAALHSLEMEDDNAKRALEMLPDLIYADIKTAESVIDFDDMIWLPIVLNLPMPATYDILFVDEYQDSNKTQQELALRACPTGRIVVIGDRHQSLYGFRGADVTAMSDAITRLGSTDRGVKIFPLTVTRRCPKSHVELAQQVVPTITALPEAAKGEVLQCSESQAVAIMEPGDMVLCRINARLMPTAYALIRRGIKPLVRGKDVGKGLLDLIYKLKKKWGANDLNDLANALAAYQTEESNKLIALGPKGSSRLEALNDKCMCLFECIREAEHIPALEDSIARLFGMERKSRKDVAGDDHQEFRDEDSTKDAVVLSTVHRAKGLEASRIFILAPELIPFPKKNAQPWETEQEMNLAYVAVTRAKFDNKKNIPGTLIFCGPMPYIFNGGLTDA